jgi:hypothetical protein
MSFYEELLALGQNMREHERLALYKYLLESQKHRILCKASDLITNSTSEETIANGVILYSISDNTISYSVRKVGSNHIYENIREVSLGIVPGLKPKKIMNFIAQAEVEVIWNFPLPGANSVESSGFGIISYPFFDLRYYSNGRGRILGFVKKMQTNDSEILNRLRAS